MDILSIFLKSIYVLNFICILALLFIKRKNPNETITWLLILSFLPVIGLFLYMVFGKGINLYSRRKYSIKEQRDRAYSALIQEQSHMDETHINLFKNHTPPFNDQAAEHHRQMIELFYHTGHSIYTQDNDVSIFTDAGKLYETLIHDIREAKESINMLYFIIKNDEIGNKIVDLLTQKADAGVEVRLIYDSLGSFFTPGRMFKRLKEAGGKVCRFFPVSLGFYLKINHRNHRKIVTIDGEIAYMGGMNIGMEYMGLSKITPWRDTHLRITGSAVLMLQEQFLLDWNFVSKTTDNLDDVHFVRKYFPPIKSPGKLGIQIVSSDPGIAAEQIKSGLIKMVYSAQESLWIQTPYFVPDEPFLEALKTASASGVDVRIMIPGLPDKKYVWNVTMSYVRDLLNAGIKVYMYSGFMHAKMVVMDDQIATIGSTNIDIRSFALHFEVNAFIYDTEFALKCKKIFIDDEMDSTQITSEWYESRGILTLLKENFSRIFSPLM